MDSKTLAALAATPLPQRKTLRFFNVGIANRYCAEKATEKGHPVPPREMNLKKANALADFYDALPQDGSVATASPQSADETSGTQAVTTAPATSAQLATPATANTAPATVEMVRQYSKATLAATGKAMVAGIARHEFLKKSAADRTQFSADGGQLRRSEIEQLTPRQLAEHFRAGGTVADDEAAPDKFAGDAVKGGAGRTMPRAQFDSMSAADKAAFFRSTQNH